MMTLTFSPFSLAAGTHYGARLQAIALLPPSAA